MPPIIRNLQISLSSVVTLLDTLVLFVTVIIWSCCDYFNISSSTY